MIHDEVLERHVISLYNDGLSIRQIAKITDHAREGIRLILKHHSVPMRGRCVKHKPFSEFSFVEKISLARLFGYLFGDGSISRNKDGRYECSLSFALTETGYVGDIKNIVESLFHFTPRVKIENESHFRILLRRSVARYLHQECYYPVGKKSVVNPHIPNWVMGSEPEVKASFTKGFLNAEASIMDEGIKIRQAVRIFPPEDILARLKQMAKIRATKTYTYFSLNWRAGKSLCEPYIRPSNILVDLRELLREFQVVGEIYPFWIWMSSINNNIGIHYELNLSKKPSERLINVISLYP